MIAEQHDDVDYYTYKSTFIDHFRKADEELLNNETSWVQPTPLRGNRSNLIKFPVNALPPILRTMAQAIARTTSTDVSMASTAILSSVSYCFSGQFRIVGKKDHSEPLVIDSLNAPQE